MKLKNILICLFLASGTIGLAQDLQEYKPSKEIKKTQVKGSQISEKNVVELAKRISEAKENQIILIEDGEYSNLGQLQVTQNGVKIRAKNPGRVIFSGDIEILIEGNNNSLEGIIFTNGGPQDKKGAVSLSGKDNTFSNNIIYDFNNYDYTQNSKGEFPSMRWITVSGKRNKILNNRFEKKNKRGPILVIDNTDLSTSDNHVIANNIFIDSKKGLFHELDNEKLKKINNNSWEVIRMGVGATSMAESESKILYNLFQEIDGEAEIISIKNSKALIKGNTIKNSSGMISLRQGKNSIVEDNVILGEGKISSGGIRFYDSNHIIKNNYIENVMGNRGMLGGITVNNGSYSLKKDGKIALIFQAPPKNNIVENNTIINSARNILYSYESHKDEFGKDVTIPADETTFQNNISFAESEGTKALMGANMMPQPKNSQYINENYFGNITGATYFNLEKDNEVKNINRKRPQLIRENGILTSTDKNLGAKNLLIITEEMVGPNFKYP